MGLTRVPGCIQRYFKEKIVRCFEQVFFWKKEQNGHQMCLIRPFYNFQISASNNATDLILCSLESLTKHRENIGNMPLKDVSKDVLAVFCQNNMRVKISLKSLMNPIRALCCRTHNQCSFPFIAILIISNPTMESCFIHTKLAKNIFMKCNPRIFQPENFSKMSPESSVFILSEYNDALKSLALKFLLVLATGTDNISQNTVLEYLTINCNFDAVIQLLSHSLSRTKHGPEAVLYLMLMVNYRKHEMTNPYTVNLSLLDDELILNGYGQVITASLSEFNHKYSAHFTEPPGSGWFASLTSMVGSMFVSEEMATRNEHIKANDSFLLALYEAVHLNRNFITALTTAADPSTPPSPATTLDRGASPPASEPSTPSPPADTNHLDATALAQPTNLLVTFLEYCNITTQMLQVESKTRDVRYCHIAIITIINSEFRKLWPLFHNSYIVFQTFPLYLLERPLSSSKLVHMISTSCDIHITIMEFSGPHLKIIPVDELMISIMNALLCYQKNQIPRMLHNWQHINIFSSTAKNIISQDMEIYEKFTLAFFGVSSFKFFRNYFSGDPLGPYGLYSGVISMSPIFSADISSLKRWIKSNSGYKSETKKFIHNLGSVLRYQNTILESFTPKIIALNLISQIKINNSSQLITRTTTRYYPQVFMRHHVEDVWERFSQGP
ncbi:unnamed protein product, partial [Meganyctiphanes norvegica]